MSLAARGQDPLGSEGESSSSPKPSPSKDVSSAEEDSEEFYTDSENAEHESDGGSRSETLSSNEVEPEEGPKEGPKKHGSVNLRQATTAIQRSGPEAKATTVVPAVIAGQKAHSSVDSSETDASSTAGRKAQTVSTISESEDTAEESATSEASSTVAKPPKASAARQAASASEDEEDSTTEESTTSNSQDGALAPNGAQKDGAKGNQTAVAKRHSWNPFASKQVITAQTLDAKIQRHLDRAGDADRRSKAANAKRTQDNGILHNSDAPFGSRVAAFFSRMGNWSREKSATRESNSEQKKVSRHRKERQRLFSQSTTANAKS